MGGCPGNFMAMRTFFRPRFWVSTGFVPVLAVFAAAMCGADGFLDGDTSAFIIKQGWGNLGIKTAAFAPGGKGSPLNIAETKYEHGLGHHAPGEITVPLNGKYLLFTAAAGVQWQGGGRGSVAFEVWVDGEKRFDSGKMTDSDPAKPVEVAVAGARELRLVAADCGDGLACDMANWADARLVRDPMVPGFGRPALGLDGDAVAGPVEMEGSYALFGTDEGSQLAFSGPLDLCAAALARRGAARLEIPVDGIGAPFTVTAEAAHAGGAEAELRLALASGGESRRILSPGGRARVTLSCDGVKATDTLVLEALAPGREAAVRWIALKYTAGGREFPVDLTPPPPSRIFPDIRAVTPHPLLDAELVEWDWRMQDGIGAGNRQSTFAAAAALTLARGGALIDDLAKEGTPAETGEWDTLRARAEELRASGAAENGEEWEALWREIHRARRAIVFSNPLAETGPLLFVKQAPGGFSHQLTQYYGRYARPGGGIFVLDRPGGPMRTRRLGADAFPQGSFMQPEVTHDGSRILVAFCATDNPPEDTFRGRKGFYYHLYGMAADGSGVRRLTDGPFDDFAPKELPDGRIVLSSTRRGGMHRCGSPGCEVYTLAMMDGGGGEVRTVSYHETQEWDPSVLNDGRVIYTRWDYVDRNAVHYQQLWTVRADGTAPAAFYGNNTLNPVGVWEARAVPGSRAVMATAAPHHGMTAGSIILVDPAKGVDGLGALTRLTPDTPFPESEAVLLPGWRSALAPEPPARTDEMDRWPGQCYRSPYPLSEKYFLAAYSYDPLIGEPKANVANMFGLYFVDAFGNRELLLRDPNISSVWPVPLRPRRAAPQYAAAPAENKPKEGVYFLQDVHDSDPDIGAGEVRRLRIVQVLPKSTSGANNPTVGAPNASPGKQVLGTVPVEPDGSAHFRAPAGVSLAFQALDGSGRALQVMRSITYLQPGETASCTGCHEHRLSAPAVKAAPAMAMRRAPSVIEPGPEGSNPLSYPLLVQPVLDRHCVRCHGGDKPAGPKGQPLVLTGEPEDRYTKSYNALVQRVSYSAWGRGTFPDGNSEPLSKPGFFGAMGSPLMEMLLAGHQGVELGPEDLDRLITWIDANALFYGTFNFEDQVKQQRGERIPGPDLQ